MLTLDSLIAQAQKLKAEGVDGATPIGALHADSDGICRLIRVDVELVKAEVSKRNFELGWSLCRREYGGNGVPVLVIEGASTPADR